MSLGKQIYEKSNRHCEKHYSQWPMNSLIGVILWWITGSCCSVMTSPIACGEFTDWCRFVMNHRFMWWLHRLLVMNSPIDVVLWRITGSCCSVMTSPIDCDESPVHVVLWWIYRLMSFCDKFTGWCRFVMNSSIDAFLWWIHRFMLFCREFTDRFLKICLLLHCLHSDILLLFTFRQQMTIKWAQTTHFIKLTAFWLWLVPPTLWYLATGRQTATVHPAVWTLFAHETDVCGRAFCCLVDVVVDDRFYVALFSALAILAWCWSVA